MKILVSACLLLSLLYPVSSTRGSRMCVACRSDDCKEIVFEICARIPGQKGCSNKIVDFPVEGEMRVRTTHYKRGCVARNMCHPVNYTASLPDGRYIHMEVKCCNTDMCNDRISVIKQEDRPLNGMQCPGCFAHIPNANQSCSSDVTVSCRGKENNCISYTGRLITPALYYAPLSFKGCATKNLCDLLTGVSEKGSDLLEPSDTTEAECSPAEYPVEEEPSPEQ